MNAPPNNDEADPQSEGRPVYGNEGCDTLIGDRLVNTGTPHRGLYAPKTPEPAVSFDYAGVALALGEPSVLLTYATPAETLQWRVREAAIRAHAGLEPRSFAEVARELGTTRAAISAAYVRIAERIGHLPLLKRLDTRRKNSEAAKRQWEQRRAKSARHTAALATLAAEKEGDLELAEAARKRFIEASQGVPQ